MQNCNSLREFDKIEILPDSRWNKDDSKSLLMHSIHVYPAKFPPMVAEEAFRFAKEEGVHYSSIADIFCGCGTVALESKRRELSFWGCDINPVAVLITKAKTNQYKIERLQAYYNAINSKYSEFLSDDSTRKYYETAPERLRYWFCEEAYNDLYCLKDAIEACVDNYVYLTAFLCIFSSVLKSASKWLQKSIKPQVDPLKKEVDIKQLFDQQVRRFFRAVKEINEIGISLNTLEIVQQNFLETDGQEKVDLIVTSPPYVTSYEYADLHQLSSLWLGYTDDYKKLRKGSIGSKYYCQDLRLETTPLNTTGTTIINELIAASVQMARIKSIARYYEDIEKVVARCANMLNKNGMALLIIGDSVLKGVKLQNSRHLVETMLDCGFSDIKIGKRIIEKSMCIPFRDASGKFTKQHASKNEIYHEEYVISGRII